MVAIIAGAALRVLATWVWTPDGRSWDKVRQADCHDQGPFRVKPSMLWLTSHYREPVAVYLVKHTIS
jgi:hypothetical protein